VTIPGPGTGVGGSGSGAGVGMGEGAGRGGTGDGSGTGGTGDGSGTGGTGAGSGIGGIGDGPGTGSDISAAFHGAVGGIGHIRPYPLVTIPPLMAIAPTPADGRGRAAGPDMIVSATRVSGCR
jgi:hypothetical protein